jgi:hypothetical protein
MNRLQLWKVVSVVLLACGLASAQTITSFSAPGAGTGAGSFREYMKSVAHLLPQPLQQLELRLLCLATRSSRRFPRQMARSGARLRAVAVSSNACGSGPSESPNQNDNRHNVSEYRSIPPKGRLG